MTVHTSNGPEMGADGMHVELIRKQLGHTSIATTARYLDHIAPWAVVDAVARRRW